MTTVHLEWDGPYSLAQLDALRPQQSPSQQPNFGIYQIYGHHAQYGPSSLLYIGKAVAQTFGVRIAQEGWSGNRDSAHVQVYVGRLGLREGERPSDAAATAALIDHVESLLIYTHGPACNAAKLQRLPATLPPDLRVMNWYAFRALMPEVSAERWNRAHAAHPDYALISARALDGWGASGADAGAVSAVVV